MSKEACLLCDWISVEPPGGWLLDDQYFVMGVAPDFEVPGWYFLAMRRHGEGPMSMSPAEAGAYGPTLVSCTAAVKEATGAERVYVIAYGELYPHWHCLISPRGADIPAELRGPALFSGRSQLIDIQLSIEVAEITRKILRRHRETDMGQPS